MTGHRVELAFAFQANFWVRLQNLRKVSETPLPRGMSFEYDHVYDKPNLLSKGELI